MIVRVLLVVALVSVSGLVAADDAEAIKAKLDKAKKTYVAEMEKFRKEVFEHLDKQEEVARTKKNNRMLVDAIKNERMAFEEKSVLPASVTGPLKKKGAAATIAMTTAYGEAVAAYTKAKLDADAAVVEKESEEFKQGRGLAAGFVATVNPFEGTWVLDQATVRGQRLNSTAPSTITIKGDYFFQANKSPTNNDTLFTGGKLVVSRMGDLQTFKLTTRPVNQDGEVLSKFSTDSVATGSLRIADGKLIMRILTNRKTPRKRIKTPSNSSKTCTGRSDF
jgi:hypothetical protein